jgi:hypothetical protein
MRRVVSGLFVVGIILSCGATSGAQTQQAPPLVPRRDSQALGVVQNAINALGGATNISQVKDWKVVAQRQASSASHSPSGEVVWEATGTEFKSDFPAANGRSVLVSGHGRPVRTGVGVTEAVPQYVLRALFVPSLVGAVLLRELQDPNYSFEFVSKNLSNRQVTIIRTFSVASETDRIATEQTWYFDSATGLPSRIEYRFPDAKDPSRFGKPSVDFSAYKSISNVLYPFQIVMSQNGVKMADVTIQSIVVNSNLPPQEFDSTGSLAGTGR